MRLTVDHVTRSHHDLPVRSVVQSHRLTPSVVAGQRVVDREVTVSEGRKGAGHRDGAGDLVQGWTIAGPVNEVSVQVRGTVETVDLSGVWRGHREVVAPHACPRATDPTRADVALDALALDALALDALARGVAGTGMQALAHALRAAVADAIACRPGVAHVHRSAAEALALRGGRLPCPCPDRGGAGAGDRGALCLGLSLRDRGRRPARGGPCPGGTAFAGAGLAGLRSGKPLLPR